MLQAQHQRPDHARQQSASSLGLKSFVAESRLCWLTKDFFYICPGHLKDHSFATPIVDEAQLSAKKRKKEMEREIEKVKAEYEAKVKKKKEKDKPEKEEKKGDKKDKPKQTDEDRNDDKEIDDEVGCELLEDT